VVDAPVGGDDRLRHPVQEVRVLLDQPDTAARIARFSHAGRVPVLLAGEMTIWDSLAICEYLAEQFPEKHLWPQDVAARAMARQACAEMHSGFADLRSAMSMNIRRACRAAAARRAPRPTSAASARSGKSACRAFGHHQFLFGDFSIADAFYAPVVMRFKTYGVSLAPALQAYCDRMLAHPAVARWVERSDGGNRSRRRPRRRAAE
jgi:glutathione S-transferase